MDAAPPHQLVGTLYVRLREELGALQPLVVGHVMRTFLDVSSHAVARGLWSLEFAFDEDDSRVAVVEARFGDGLRAARTGARLQGYELRILLPKTLPQYTAETGRNASEHLLTPADPNDLIARFVRSLTALGAYRLIEPLEAESVETELLL